MTKYKCGAVITETRHFPNLQEIIDAHVKYLPKDWEVTVVRDVKVETLQDYNRLMTSRDFWEKLPYDKVLVFQTDSMLLRSGVEDFLDYDYIGAPLFHIDFPAMNGGLSLRSKKAMLEVIDKIKYNYRNNEDIYFCNGLKEIGGRLPSKEIAESFSMETIFKLGTVGCHAIEKWNTPEQCDQILNQYKHEPYKNNQWADPKEQL